MTTSPEGAARDISAEGEPRGEVPDPRPHTVRQALRIALVALWVVWAGCAWWSAPRPAEVNQLLKDAAAGRITSVQRFETWSNPGPPGWAVPRRPSYSTQGSHIAWSTTSGQVRYTGPSVSMGDFELHDVPKGDLGQDDLLAVLQREAAKSVTDPDRVAYLDQGPFTRVAGITGGVLAAVTLAMVVLGPAPRRGTRWYWFWLWMGPFGLGVLLWLRREHPWAPQVPDPLPDPRNSPASAGTGRREDDRDRGFTGFALMFVVGAVAAMVTWGARSLLGPGIIPG